MKIRSTGELQDFLDDQLATRKREISTLGFLIDEARAHQQGVLLRAAYPILYAHWEGFVKNSATAYLDYVSRLGTSLKELSENLAAVAVRPQIRVAAGSNKIDPHIAVTRFLFEGGTAALPPDAIDTKSNLSFEVLSDILTTIGIDIDPYWATKAHLIDYQLLRTRNAIAHGTLEVVDAVEYSQLAAFVLQSLERVRTDILNAAVLNRHLRPH